MLPSGERTAYLRLALVPGIGPARLAALYRHFGSYQEALAAPLRELRAIESMGLAAATAIVTADRDRLPAVLDRSDRFGATVVTPFEPGYPALLREIGDPPPVLFVKGRLELLSRPRVAVVGTRRPTGYGIEVTRTVAGAAAAAGLTVVSGLARGLDAVAHWAALDHEASTIGVLGNGIDVVYPAANRTLYERVLAEGLLLTEYPPGDRPHAGSFLSRNRIISGLARVTVVTEAPLKSGAVNTATEALAEQSREVLVVPGLVTSKKSEGVNGLLRDGAHPYLVPDDLFQFYPEATPRPSAGPNERPLSPRLRAVFSELDGLPRSVDDLARELRLNAGEVAGALVELEVAGLVVAGGQGFTRAP